MRRSFIILHVVAVLAGCGGHQDRASEALKSRDAAIGNRDPHAPTGRQVPAPSVPEHPLRHRFVGEWQIGGETNLVIRRGEDGRINIESPESESWESIINNVRFDGNDLRFDHYSYFTGPGGHPFSGVRVASVLVLVPDEENRLKFTTTIEATPTPGEYYVLVRAGTPGASETITGIDATAKDDAGASGSLTITQVGSPVVSPSGDYVAFRVLWADPQAADAYRALAEVVKSGGPESTNRVEEAASRLKLEARLGVLSVTDKSIREFGDDAFAGTNPITWSPDGSQIVFVSQHMDHLSQSFEYLRRVDLSDGQVSTLVSVPFTQTGDRIFHPRFSPDGKYLGFVKDYRSSQLIVRETATGKDLQLAEGIDLHNWCWNNDGSGVFYVRENSIWKHAVADGEPRVVYTAAAGRYPTQLVCSPSGDRVGFELKGSFLVVDLESGHVEKLFDASHYFLEFDWTDAGICYLDAVDGERRKRGRLMIYRPEQKTPEEVAVGPFAYPRWLTASSLLVRRGNNEFWVHDLETGEANRIFPMK